MTTGFQGMVQFDEIRVICAWVNPLEQLAVEIEHTSTEDVMVSRAKIAL